MHQIIYINNYFQTVRADTNIIVEYESVPDQ